MNIPTLKISLRARKKLNMDVLTDSVTEPFKHPVNSDTVGQFAINKHGIYHGKPSLPVGLRCMHPGNFQPRQETT